MGEKKKSATILLYYKYSSSKAVVMLILWWIVLMININVSMMVLLVSQSTSLHCSLNFQTNFEELFSV